MFLLNAETVSKFLHPRDRGGLCLFGDSGAATLIQATRQRPSHRPCWIGPIVYGTDGQGARTSHHPRPAACGNESLTPVPTPMRTTPISCT